MAMKAAPRSGGWRVPHTARALHLSIARGARIGEPMRDDAYEPSSARLRELGVTDDLHDGIRSDELVSMGQVVVADDGGSLRTFSGGLAHECGWYPSWKAHRVQHWEGISARNFIVASECDTETERFQSEGIAFRFFLAPRWHVYTADFDARINGRRHVVEIKRDEDDLADPEYRIRLAAVAEICRRCGWIFRVVLADEIFAGRHHARNCELFAARRFVHTGPRVVERLEEHAIRRGSEATYGELAEVLAPGAAPRGAAFVQALTVRGRIEIDLTGQLRHSTPLRIVRRNTE